MVPNGAKFVDDFLTVLPDIEKEAGYFDESERFARVQPCSAGYKHFTRNGYNHHLVYIGPAGKVYQSRTGQVWKELMQAVKRLIGESS